MSMRTRMEIRTTTDMKCIPIRLRSSLLTVAGRVVLWGPAGLDC
jgi:hypothetical protein